MISRVLTKTGAMVWDRRIIYKSVVQSVMLYVSESWVVMGGMLKFLEVFFHQAARRITGMMGKYFLDGE